MDFANRCRKRLGQRAQVYPVATRARSGSNAPRFQWPLAAERGSVDGSTRISWALGCACSALQERRSKCPSGAPLRHYRVYAHQNATRKEGHQSQRIKRGLSPDLESWIPDIRQILSTQPDPLPLLDHEPNILGNAASTHYLSIAIGS